jgi:hypothetical protein
MHVTLEIFNKTPYNSLVNILHQPHAKNQTFATLPACMVQLSDNTSITLRNEIKPL